MSSPERAIEAAAEAWFHRTQAGRMDPGRFNDDGTLIGWDDLSDTDRAAYRALVEPIVSAALGVEERK